MLQAVCEALETCVWRPSQRPASTARSASTPSFLCLRHQASAKLGHPLRGCGVPEDFITYLPSLIGTMQPIQYPSCFISDRSQDEEFARRLHEKMRGEKLRVWFAPEDMQSSRHRSARRAFSGTSIERLKTVCESNVKRHVTRNDDGYGETTGPSRSTTACCWCSRSTA